ncbi:MAG: hypothetical protein EXQ97_03385 [Alphaproteobacteria bacterium]|nr:hypothetical protein [Alphaproteobacteria bacterium]
MLSAPEGTAEIIVSVALDPADGRVMLYGWTERGALQPVLVEGSAARIGLPFARPQVYLEYLSDIRRIRVRTLGFLRSP